MKNFSFFLIMILVVFSCKGSTDDNTEIYSVSITVSPRDAGFVSPSTDSTYEEGQSVMLEAIPTEGYKFSNWSGGINSTNNPLPITVDKNFTLAAVFEKKNYSLTLNTSGEGTINEEVIQQKAGDYEYNTVVELTANSAENWIFTEWQGDLNSIENPSRITIDAPKEITAVFEKKSYSLTVNVTGNGEIQKNPDQSNYKYGTKVDLRAIPTDRWSFDQWKGDISGTTNPITITIDDHKSITGKFTYNNIFSGTWELDPVVNISCPFIPFSIGDVHVPKFMIHQISSDELDLTIPIIVASGTYHEDIKITTPFDPYSESFTTDINGTIDAHEMKGEAKIHIDGQLLNLSTIVFKIEIEMQITSLSTPYGDLSGSCDDLDLTVEGARIEV